MRPNAFELAVVCCTAAGAWAISQLATKLLGRPNPQERLLDAAKQGSVAGVTRALAAGAPVDSRDPATRETPLIKAAGGRRAGHTEVLQALLAAGACPHYTDAAGNAALHIAAASGSEGYVAALLEAGAAIDQPNHEGLAPLELAFQRGHTATVLALLSRGADPAPLQTCRSSRSWTAFRRSHAAAVRRAELAFLLRLERKWKESAASTSAAASGSGGASSSSSEGGGAWAGWPAGPAELPEPCPICFSEPPDFTLDSCGCAACFSCLRTHAATEVKQGQWPRCPLCVAVAAAGGGAADGGVLISRNQLEYLLDPGDLLLHDRQQLEQLLSLRSCPHCGEGLELGPGVDLLTATCPHPRCGRPLHVEDAAAEQAFRRFSSQQKLRECPKCGAMVERVHGCNHMTCRCRTHFCYLCGKDLTSMGGALYAHFGLRCRAFG